jgi:phage recombination protein Bet
MNNQSNNGLAVVGKGQTPALDKISFTEEHVEVIKSQFGLQSAKDAEVQYCFSVAKQLGLNPIVKEIYFVERGSYDDNNKWQKKIEPMVSRDGFLKIAHETGMFAGIDTTSEIREVPCLSTKNYMDWETRKELVATCKVWRKDTEIPFVVEVNFSEYKQTKKDGSLTKFWKEKPNTMLKKVAESQCLRKAFNINGVYSVEEVGYGDVTADGEVITDDPPKYRSPKQEPKEVTELEKLNALFKSFDGSVVEIDNVYHLTFALKTGKELSSTAKTLIEQQGFTLTEENLYTKEHIYEGEIVKDDKPSPSATNTNPTAKDGLSAAVENLGLKLEVLGGYAKINGVSYDKHPKAKELVALGFEWVAGKKMFVKKLADAA